MKKISPVIIILVAVLMVLSGPTSSFAQRPLNVGYFSGYDYGNTLRRANTHVMLQGGLPKYAYDSKAGFEDFIVSNLGDGDFNTGSMQTMRNKVGAAFIIQTMRGGTDYTAPNYAQIADWQTRINSNSVSFSLQTIGYTLDTAIVNRSPGGGRILNDAAQYIIAEMTGQTALVFGFPGGSYAIRVACANPVGDLGNGIPKIPTDYNLNPDISADRTSGVAGTAVQVSPTVTNSGHAASGNSQWQLSQFVVPPSGSYPGAGNSPSAPAAYYGNTLIRLSYGEGVSFPVGSPNPIGQSSQTVPDYPIGTKICYALSVQARSDTDGRWAHSTPKCVVVSKSPLVHVLGGDLRVGATFAGSDPLVSQITTSVTIKTDKSYGSWDEYAIAAAGSITGMASGSAYRDGLSCTSNCATNNLTFANFIKLGNFKPTTPIPDVAASFPVTTSTLKFSSLADATNRRVETASSPGADIKIDGGTIAKGNWLVINAPTSTVTITGDITYDSSPLQNISDIPQLVIIANQINIEGNVGKVDAWLIALGSVGAINTCSAWKNSPVALSDKLSSDICSDPLVINGPVMAKTLYLRRTAGADNGPDKSDNPAEVINLRPDAYLWGLARVGQSGRLTTVYETELPPRF